MSSATFSKKWALTFVMKNENSYFFRKIKRDAEKHKALKFFSSKNSGKMILKSF